MEKRLTLRGWWRALEAGYQVDEKVLGEYPDLLEKPYRETYSRGETDELGGANPMTRNVEDRTPWDLVQENDARFDAMSEREAGQNLREVGNV